MAALLKSKKGLKLFPEVLMPKKHAFPQVSTAFLIFFQFALSSSDSR